ncbi:MAG TPA: ABC transporter ATP-binding protein [Caulobacteraceae bacterium]|nr:ABC transporter ATP-binding protein [Caulobacteraceae bacterium]
MTAALEIDGLGVQLGGRIVLTDVTLAVEPGEVVGVLGPNGAGKTTLLRAAIGLQARSAGVVRLGSRPLETLNERERAGLAAYLPQERRVAWNMPAWRIAALGAYDRAPVLAHALALEQLDALEIGDLAERGVLDMSGGERARVLLARLLVTRAPLLVADEPAAGLDPETQFLALMRLRERATAGAAVVVTLHDLTLAARFCDRVAVMDSGRIVAAGAPLGVLTPDLLAGVFALDGALVETEVGLVLAAQRVATKWAAP